MPAGRLAAAKRDTANDPLHCERCGRFMNGSVVAVDGGYTAQ
jgi:hypothetical protein